MIKLVNMEDLNKAAQKQVTKEARIMQRLQGNPNIVLVKESYSSKQGKVLNIVMEYADGGDLDQKIE